MKNHNLKELRLKNKLSQKDLADVFGVSQQAVAKWEKGGFPEASMVRRLADYFGVSADFVLGLKNTFQPGFAAVNIIGLVKAGYDCPAEEEYLGREYAEVKNAADYRYLIVEGDSMYPHILEGDLALVRLQPSLENGDLGVFIYQGEATLKRYRREKEAVILEPFNSDYKKLCIKGKNLNNLRIFGKVVETKRRW
jgi:repressor LexA